MNNNKKIVLLIFLVVTSVLTMNLIAVVIYLLAKAYLYLFQDVPLGNFLSGFLRAIRGASIGGLIAGIGCWFLYLKK
ncbi:hypothetical protein RIN58_00150 [Siccibacter colletis]|uniref:hypothetical protein n=1 Tax=Siccibacter colletis TaxID=1505757 RepID=UPI0028BE54F5|nr:hypothetical protein [Siccibacter colletis]WNN48568.1 hypothetical protein RIN58_00150 [Siccibacter colletis]